MKLEPCPWDPCFDNVLNVRHNESDRVNRRFTWNENHFVAWCQTSTLSLIRLRGNAPQAVLVGQLAENTLLDQCKPTNAVEPTKPFLFLWFLHSRNLSRNCLFYIIFVFHIPIVVQATRRCWCSLWPQVRAKLDVNDQKELRVSVSKGPHLLEEVGQLWYSQFLLASNTSHPNTRSIQRSLTPDGCPILIPERVTRINGCMRKRESIFLRNGTVFWLCLESVPSSFLLTWKWRRVDLN